MGAAKPLDAVPVLPRSRLTWVRETIGGVGRLFACVRSFVPTFRSHDATAATEESS